MPRPLFSLCSFVLAVSALALATGCSSTLPPGATREASAPLTGRVYGGQQPITGATIGLYAVSVNTTDGGASTSILNNGITIITSDGTGVIGTTGNASNNYNQLPAGYYNIDNSSFTCPSGDPQTFLTASAGNPGLTAGTNNTAIQQMLPLGACSMLAARQSAIINEATTVGMVAALYPYISGYNAVGGSAAHASDLVSRFTLAAEYIDASTGTSPGPSLPAGYYADSAELYSLANSVAACVNTISGTSSNCNSLFTYATPPANATLNPNVKPTDTLTALVDIRNNPTNNVSLIYNLSSAIIAFYPYATTTPADWSLPIVVQPGTPTFTPAAGSYAAAQTVTIADSDATAVIYYTTDGSTPTTSSTIYTGPVFVSTAETLNALAVESGRAFSAVGSAAYTGTLTPTTPTVSLASISATYQSTTAVTLTASSTANGSVVTFGKGTGVDGSFSAATCTIAGGSCSVNYIPSGTLAVGTYTAGLTASFSAYGSYAAATATGTLTVNPTYTFTLLDSFTGNSGAATGANPQYGNLIQGSDGSFYGMTRYGGANGYGAAFKVTSAGTFTLLHSFSTAATDGEYPFGSLVQGSDGSFYGMTSAGGANSSSGTVFKITSAGTLTLLHSFSTATTDGSSPYGSLVQGSDGSFYGTTYAGGANGKGTVFNITSAGTFTLLHSFSTAATDGYNPNGSLVQGSDGSFYGTTSAGGANGKGTVFKITSAGTFTLLHSFSAATTDGYYPYGSLVQGPDGSFYGLTENGGANTKGTVFNITSTGTFTSLHSFSTATTDGQNPYGSLVQGSDGSFYGMTYGGGANTSFGTVFKITSAGTFSLPHSFSFAATDGFSPQGSLVQGSDGSFYGMTLNGGADGDGIIFKLAAGPALAAPVTLTVPASVVGGTTFTLGYAVSNATSTTLQTCQYFATNSSGTQVATGALTGSTTAQNATLTAPATAGTYTYALTCGGIESGFATLTVTTPPTAAAPTSSPVAGTYTGTQSVTLSTTTTGASIYYTTNNSTPTTASTLYTGPITVAATENIKAIAGGTGFTASSVATASYTIHTAPTVSLTAVTAVYGDTTPLTLTASSNATGSVVTFGKGTGVDGTFSAATCTISASGTCSVNYNPSGTLAAGTYSPGLTASFGAVGTYGTATTSSTLTVVSYNYSVLANLTGSTGAYPGAGPQYGNLIQGGDGYFYGMTYNGGTNNTGIIFKINAAGSTYTVLRSLATADGTLPYGSLVRGSDGYFYGMTSAGGTNGFGTIFKIDATGASFTVLRSLAAADGEKPYGALVQGSDGYFYGMTSAGGTNTYGTIFKIDATGATFTVIRSFAAADGESPRGSLIQGSDGNFYGMAHGGGSSFAGTIFTINATGSSFTVLKSFIDRNTGSQPYGSLVQGADGYFYGVTASGGGSGYGTIFKVNATGSTYTVLFSFTSAGGTYCYGTLVLGSDGYFYGLTNSGGANGNGTIFRMNATGSIYTVLRSFVGNTDGQAAEGSLVQGSDGSFYGMTPAGGANSVGTLFKLAPSPTFAAPVTLTVPASVTHGNTFTLGYAVSNSASTAGVTATTNTTLQSCQYFATNSSGTQVATGALTAATTNTNTTLTAPATAGTYTYALTCGGTETGFATLTVN